MTVVSHLIRFTILQMGPLADADARILQIPHMQTNCKPPKTLHRLLASGYGATVSNLNPDVTPPTRQCASLHHHPISTAETSPTDASQSCHPTHTASTATATASAAKPEPRPPTTAYGRMRNRTEAAHTVGYGRI
jgi:hypothetical protein